MVVRRGESEVKIVFAGLRPAEKLCEEMLADDEQALTTPHPKMRIARTASETAVLEGLHVWLDGASPDDNRGWDCAEALDS
jgi:FlaA1/EpsC-like NDP-sugar epimerase